LSTIILTAINFPLISAIELQLDSPEFVKLEEAFSTEISADTTEDHDVKIFIRNNEDNLISEIFSDGWKNPYYYLKEAFPEQSEFKIQALETGKHEICLRLRQTGKTSFDEKCNEIEILEKEEKQEELQSTEDISEKIEEPTKKQLESNENKLINQIENTSYTKLTNPNEKIILNSRLNNPDIKFTTKKGNLRSGILYTFTAFCVIIIILLALKKL
jgi:hypothetical protein